MDSAFNELGGFPGGDDRQNTRRTFRGNAQNAKTRICLRWKEGHCRFGDRCNFAHGVEELRGPEALRRGGQSASDLQGGGLTSRFGGAGSYSGTPLRLPSQGGDYSDLLGLGPSNARQGYGGLSQGFEPQPSYGGLHQQTGYGGAQDFGLGGAGGNFGQGLQGYSGGGGGRPALYGGNPMGAGPLHSGLDPSVAGAPGGGGGYGEGPALRGNCKEGFDLGHHPANKITLQEYPVVGPGGWMEYRDLQSGDPYYHNQRTRETVWDRPTEWGP